MSKWKRPSFWEGMTKNIKHKDGTLQKDMPIPTPDPTKRRSNKNLTRGAFGTMK